MELQCGSYRFKWFRLLILYTACPIASRLRISMLPILDLILKSVLQVLFQSQEIANYIEIVFLGLIKRNLIPEDTNKRNDLLIRKPLSPTRTLII